MTSDDERLQILKMVEEGQITADEAAKLLDALEERAPREGPGGSPRWLRIQVTDMKTGKRKVNVNLPMRLLDLGAKIYSRYGAPGDIDVEGIAQAIKEGAQGKIVEAEDDVDGERVEVYVE